MPVYRVKLEDSWLVEAETALDAMMAMEEWLKKNGYDLDLESDGAEVDDLPHLRVGQDGEAEWIDEG